ncbi:PLP-dependent aminotransferase family protein [Ethanoligenens harbinense]|uniref:Putative transcriptional regulator, GntR family n=1 Tax=Ethanoligenens harbinense (strain DSM 18485 / JCM 12961 / CGMCC 1.5033 / YUAN-3) TaxID=663278 RepID=E6U9I7_ETHHY|nr:PLP-dependent aminotransferase family protein [Ethanoligenens harbinense]ADU26178.1 putative transcriptional regulator, GntR family [Ethanoligenens harbinense YUAN-3]AVQ95316.1 PLP-dependent aminotransferase family protein [Ethanoligenens harbinense YUAN-3]AYF37981.1 PLP-dependent aminotransferase family protein [Ethanoligenens harbinense]AYF40727.1 PLP-dependent aminotransferase family protein [Ethanoligenens harbinense]QCN91560.1 PLP-dependent aminotransferase family protein [Ethanoligene
METAFATRMRHVKKSFIREILKVTEDPSVISFAGGLPNPASFPVEAVSRAAQAVLAEDGASALQYSTTEGFLPLREFICARYAKRFGLHVSPEEILITNGSQQGLDLLGKIFLDEGDGVLLEAPGYLGAIQALSLYQPRFCTVPLREDGVNISALRDTLDRYGPKLFYAVPNFQNPSGLTYTKENREAAAALLRRHATLFIEDDPYGELRFAGEETPSMRQFLGEQSILLGSFSKIVAPAMRLGWICAKPEIMEKLVVAKQACDLHTNTFAQRVVARYLADNDLDAHIAAIRQMYKERSDCMADAIARYFPPEVRCTRPQGGMFMWAELPQGMSSMELFNEASAMRVAFVPGAPFYVDRTDAPTLRLNYTNSDEAAIVEGIRRLGRAMDEMLNGRVCCAQ